MKMTECQRKLYCACYENNASKGSEAIAEARSMCAWWMHNPDPINHPSHYGGEDNPYEAIKVIEAWKLGFNLGNTIKYISRAGKKGNALEDLKKAQWYLSREIANLEKGQ